MNEIFKKELTKRLKEVFEEEEPLERELFTIYDMYKAIEIGITLYNEQN